MTSKDPLLQPIGIRHLTLRNRIISTAHEPGYAVDGMPTERYRLYHSERAKGGIAACFTGASNIAPDSTAAFSELYLGTDEVVPHMRELAAEVQGHGAAMFAQITHRGRRDRPVNGHFLPSIAPSAVRERSHRTWPKEMEAWDFDRVLQQFADAAQRCVDGNLSGIEIAAYSHLLDSFWSPETNLRTDRYGGSLENRIRFAVEVIEAVRRRIGAHPIVGMRLVVDERRPNGLQADEGVEIARAIASTGLIDYLNVVAGQLDTDLGLAKAIPPMGTPSAPYLDLAARVKKSIDIPVFRATRIGDVATARFAIAEGLIDVVGMTRAHMADPHIVRKIKAGEEARIRPCVGAGFCIDKIYIGGKALCIHNPATGMESDIPHEVTAAETNRTIIVGGGGPAGLEAARVCARRGHKVTLIEAASRLGGQQNLASSVKRRKEIAGIADWLIAEIEHEGVEVRLNCLADAQDILGLDPDIVIVATGGLPDTEFLQFGSELVHTSWDVLSGQTEIAKDVLVYDGHGDHQGLACVEYMADAAAPSMTVVSPERTIGLDVGCTNYPAYYEMLYRNDVMMVANHELVGVERFGARYRAHLLNPYTNEIDHLEASQVVVENGTVPASDLYEELKGMSRNAGEIDQAALLERRPQPRVANTQGAFDLFRIGDAVATRDVHTAIMDARRLCLAI